VPSGTWWSRNRTFILVVVALFLLFALTGLLFTFSGTGSGGADIGEIVTTP
jgi:hypothetical protein